MGSCRQLPLLQTSTMLLLCLLISSPLLTLAGNPQPLGQGTGNDQYKPVEEIVYENKCLPYVEKTCLTQQQEQCKEVFEKNCTVVIDEFEERECFDVTELMCSLAESIQYEMVDGTYTVQRCTGVTDRVCDTVYDLAQSTKDDFQCVDIDYQYCWDEDKMVKDRTCIFSVDFDCKKKKPYDGKGAVQCEKTLTKKCYDTPRKVQEEICKPQTSKYCEKFTNEFPYPVEKQNCHTEPMKKCELESRTRPKKAKKYIYNKECKPVTRQVCENREGKKLRPVCDKIKKNVCSYKPVEKCEEEKKEYCFKVEKKVWKKVCTPEKKVIVDDTFSYV